MTDLYRRLLALKDVPGLLEVDDYENFEATTNAVGGDGASLPFPSGSFPVECPSENHETLTSPQTTKHRQQHVRTPENDQVDTDAERRLCEKIQIDVLGKLSSGGVKVFSSFHRRVEVIKDVSRMSYEDLLSIAGTPAKAYVVRKFLNGPIEGLHELEEVREAISYLSGYRTIGKQTELGVGCWAGVDDHGRQDGSVIVVGVGEAAEWTSDQQLVRITHPRCRNHLLDFNSSDQQWYDFEKLKALLENCDDDFAENTKDELVSLFGKWNWKYGKQSPDIMAGLVFATFVQSIWEWRPQVAITGPSKAGKTFLANCLSGLFGSLCIKSSHSTKAGILQAIQNSSKIMLCDEFENSRYRDEIIETLRASGRGDSILRGTADQKGHGYCLRHIVWVAAIEVGLNREADKNRFIMLELVRPEENQKGKLILPSAKELYELGMRVLAVSIKYCQAAMKMAVKLKETRIPGVDERIVESYAVPAAMTSAIDGSTIDDAKEALRHMLDCMELIEVGGVKDEADLMESILSAHVFTGRETYAVGQLIETVIAESEKENDEYYAPGHEFLSAVQGLAKCGIRVTSDAICLAYKTVGKHLLKNTHWGGQSIDQVLKRVDGVSVARQRIGGHQPWCVVIPLTVFRSEFLEHDKEKEILHGREEAKKIENSSDEVAEEQLAEAGF